MAVMAPVANVHAPPPQHDLQALTSTRDTQRYERRVRWQTEVSVGQQTGVADWKEDGASPHCVCVGAQGDAAAIAADSSLVGVSGIGAAAAARGVATSRAAATNAKRRIMTRDRGAGEESRGEETGVAWGREERGCGTQHVPQRGRAPLCSALLCCRRGLHRRSVRPLSVNLT